MPTLEYFMLYRNSLEYIEQLTNEERGRLFSAICEYAFNDTLTECKGNERFIFPAYKAAIDRSAEKAEELSEKRSAAGKHGGRPKKQPLSDESKKSNCFSEKQKNQMLFDKSKKSNCKQEEYEYEKEKEKEEEYEKESDVEMRRIADDHNELFDAAERAGFGKTETEREKIVDLYSQFGKERCLEAIDACATYGKPSVAYMRGVLTNNGSQKPQGAKPVYNPFLESLREDGVVE